VRECHPSKKFTYHFQEFPFLFILYLLLFNSTQLIVTKIYRITVERYIKFNAHFQIINLLLLFDIRHARKRSGVKYFMIYSYCREVPYFILFYVTREKETAQVQKWRIISISRNRAARDSGGLSACFIKITHVHEGNFVHQDSSLRDAPAPACGPRARLMSRVTSERDFERSPCRTADWSTRVNGFSLFPSFSLSLSLSLSPSLTPPSTIWTIKIVNCH